MKKFEGIKGFLDPEEGNALYEFCRSSHLNGVCAEIGSYCGKSACYIGQACKQVGSKLYSVDHHKGSEEQQFGEEYFDEEIFDYSKNEVNTLPLFLSNISKFELDNFIEPVIMTSEEASKVVPNELDFLFIDGSHSFESANNDYENWKHLIEKHGALAFHDIYEDPSKGGQAPYKVFQKAIDDGFKIFDRVDAAVCLTH